MRVCLYFCLREVSNTHDSHQCYEAPSLKCHVLQIYYSQQVIYCGRLHKRFL